MSWTRDEELRENPPDKPFCSRYPTCSQRLWPKFDKYLQGRGLDHALARDNFWFPSRTVDGYDRLVVPATSDQAGNLYWQARLLGAEEPRVRRWESPHGISRGRSVCVVWPRKTEAAPARSVVVEGPMDALAAAGEGYLAVALMGVTPATEVLDLTFTLICGTLPLMVTDMGAEKPMAENAQYIAEEWDFPIPLKVPYPYKDLAEMPRVKRHQFLATR